MREKKLYLVIFMAMMCWSAVTNAQTGFVHLQTENSQPFYVQWNGYIFNSSGSGYLVIPKMPAGDQTMVIGFGKKQFADYIFKYNVEEKPRAFSLKLNVDNSWSLFDMVSFALVNGKALTADDKKEYASQVDQLLRSSQTNESNVYKSVAMKDTSGIYKIFDKATDEGTDMVYVVNNNGVMDTVVIFVPILPVAPPKPAETGMISKQPIGQIPAFACNQPRAAALLNKRRLSPIN